MLRGVLVEKAGAGAIERGRVMMALQLLATRRLPRLRSPHPPRCSTCQTPYLKWKLFDDQNGHRQLPLGYIQCGKANGE